MKRSNRLVILVGVLLAILAFVGGVFVLNGTGGPTEPEIVQATVLVAKVDIALGDAVNPIMVESKQVNPEAVQGHPLSDPSQVNGRFALYAIPRGSQVNEEAFGGSAADVTCISCQLQPGERAIAFQLDRVTGLDFLILPGDHVDVVMSQRIGVVQPTIETQAAAAADQRFEGVVGLEAAPTVKTVLQNKRVLYVSATNIKPSTTGAEATPAPAESGGTTSEITSIVIIIAGTDQDAEVIKLAQNSVVDIGSLTVVLRAPKDTVPEATTGVTLSLLVKLYGVPVPDVVRFQP